MKNILNRIKSYRAAMVFIAKISKGHNSVKNVGRVMDLFLYKSSDGGLYLNKI